MKIVLSSLGFINNDITYNKNVILNAIKENNCDLIVFGEMFLQGFMSLTFNYEVDKNIAINIENPLIDEIKNQCKKYSVAVSFGYAERDNENIYSSQLTIDKHGNIINNYHRQTKGWKEKYADKHYLEGDDITVFMLDDKKFTIGLCGDLWDDSLVDKYNKLNIDILLWPLYVDYNVDEWNKTLKYEYAKQASRIAQNVIIVNPYSLDNINETAKGGSIYVKNGKIINEIDAGIEGNLIINI